MNFSQSLRHVAFPFLPLAIFFAVFCSPSPAGAQNDQREDEIVANLAGGRVIIHVAKDAIIFAAIDHPIEANSVPPRVMDLDRGHVGVILGASEWQVPANPRPIRLDRDFQAVPPANSHFQSSGEAEPDLEAIGVAMLEKLRPLAARLHHKIDLSADEPLLQLVVIGYAPQGYGPEVWIIEYRMTQEQVATRGEYWQTRTLRPRFMQIYPPEKHEPRKIVEARYPPELQGPTLQTLIEGNEPSIARLRSADARFAKVFEAIDKGQAQKAAPADAADVLRAEIPLIAPNAKFVMGKMEEQRGFDWIIPPDEPVEKTKEDKDRPPDAPSLRRKPNPN